MAVSETVARGQRRIAPLFPAANKTSDVAGPCRTIVDTPPIINAHSAIDTPKAANRLFILIVIADLQRLLAG